MKIESDNEQYPFIEEDQLQPCSLDLRLSNIFWKPISSKTLDLRGASLPELLPRKNWKKMVLRRNEYITLKPGKILLGRTCEKFTVPPEYAGQIIGRSSFARMGIGIHCMAGFINPG